MWQPPLATPVTVAIDGDTYTLPAIETTDLLAVLAEGNWWHIIPGLLDDPGLLLERLEDTDDPFDLDDVYGAARAVVKRLAGCDWWPAIRLAATLTSKWMVFDGWCATRGFDPTTAPLHRTLAAGYAWLAEDRDESQLAKLDHDLFDPPLWAGSSDTIPRWTSEEESDTFMTAMRELA